MQTTIYTGTTPKKEIFTVFSEILEELILEDDKVVYIDADLMGSLKTTWLWKKYSNNVFNTGIQEANMTGVAAGMNIIGLKPYIHSFAAFASRRMFDQVFISIAYAHKSVRVIGSDAGICASYNGGTHMALEDMALMRAVPNACVIDVTDAAMMACFLRKMKDRPGLTYFRTARRGAPDVYPEGTDFSEGEGKVLKDGKDVTIIASGIMVATALEAANLLMADDGIDAAIIDIVTVKPIDVKLVTDYAKKTGAIITAENHNIIGGLGSAVSDCITEMCPVPLRKIGVHDSFGQVGSEEYLRKIYGLTAENIASEAKKILSTR